MTYRPPAQRTPYPITVVICAYTMGRWSDLRAAAASVARQLSDDDELVIVIDHCPPLLRLALDELRGCRVIANDGRPGLSDARNTGVAASRGDVVAFLDDDATARPGWLESIRAAFAHGDVAVTGTRVEPRWQGDAAPRWFPEEFGWVVGCSYRGLPTQRRAVRNPIGASMAIRRSSFETVGGFSRLVGRVGTLPVGCEETEFCIRLAKASPVARIVFEPGAAVDHFVPRQRQTVKYFLSRCYHEGRSKAAVARLGGSRSALSAERHYVRSVLPRAVLRALNPVLLRREPVAALRGAAVVAGLAATVAGYVAGSRTRRAPA
ncbi:glycosyltransferase family 2 protein [Paractinoplanes deccanensis]|uniref:glycosyltransferase family 2 protein n=1 Tax=Paractinoplanes deccanensis TaxID=113561 RepID=UPI00194462A3|nr:glycosyltransferase family 2 protein [Actinoplanes deccanensis]